MSDLKSKTTASTLNSEHYHVISLEDDSLTLGYGDIKEDSSIINYPAISPVINKVVKCSVCGKKILIESFLCGVSHVVEIVATCWDCLDDEAKKKLEEEGGAL